MKTKIALLLIIIGLAAFLFLRIESEANYDMPRALFLKSPVSETINDVVKLPALVKDLDFDVVRDAQKAREILSQYKIKREFLMSKKWAWANRKKKIKRHWIEKRLQTFDVLLAVENIYDRRIKIIKFDDKSGKSLTPGFEIALSKENGVNSQFNIRPEGWIVLAIKRPVNLRKGGTEDAVYSPYSKSLDVPSVREEGLEYVKGILSSAKYRLEARLVYSAVIPGEFVARIVSTDVAEILLIIEHIDPTRFKRGVPVERLVNEVLTVIGLNKGKAYTYAVSPAGARGLFQFIPRTYRLVSQQYPGAGLKKDFVAGMNDHVNAAMASLLLFDSDLSYADSTQRSSLLSDKRALGYYLASSYNGGATRTVKSMEKHGEGWIKGLLPETRVYLEKYSTVSGMVQ